MLPILSSLLHFLLLAVCLIAAALSLIVYRGRGYKVFLYTCSYMLSLLLLELLVRGYETQDPVWVSLWTHLTPTELFRSLLYAVCAVLTPHIFACITNRPISVVWNISALVITLWLIVFSLLADATGLLYFLYLLPYQLFVIVSALVGFRRLLALPSRGAYPLLRVLLLGIAVLTVLTVAEDILTGVSYGLGQDLTEIIEAGRIKNRNFCENITQLGMAGFVIYAAARILIDALRTTQPSVPQELSENADRPVDRFAESIGLSAREREILPLLLQNKGTQEISKALFISTGTVKSHTHNIYQKADVSDRGALIQKAAVFFDEAE